MDDRTKELTELQIFQLAVNAAAILVAGSSERSPMSYYDEDAIGKAYREITKAYVAFSKGEPRWTID